MGVVTVTAAEAIVIVYVIFEPDALVLVRGGMGKTKTLFTSASCKRSFKTQIANCQRRLVQVSFKEGLVILFATLSKAQE